jgi:hypothetical protein
MDEDEESRCGEMEENKNQFRSPSSKDSLLLFIAGWRGGGGRERERDQIRSTREQHIEDGKRRKKARIS